MDIYRRLCEPKNILLVHSVLGAPKSQRGAGVAMAMSMGPVAMRLKRATGSAAVMSALRTLSLRFASSSSAGSGTGELSGLSGVLGVHPRMLRLPQRRTAYC